MAITGTPRRQFGNGAIRSEITNQGKALALFDVKTRNSLARGAFIAAGNAWIANFLPKRFTPYVFRAPFGYGARKGPWLATKLRKTKGGLLPQRWADVKRKWFDGWDPWSSNPPPPSLEKKWLDRNPEKYKRRGGVVGFVLTLHASKVMREDLRKWCKTKTREIAQNMQSDDIILPLVASGQLRDVLSKTARANSTATAKRVRMWITIPRGDRQSQTVGRVLGTLPYHEFDYIVRQFTDRFRTMIRDETIATVDRNVASFVERRAARKEAAAARRADSAYDRRVSAIEQREGRSNNGR